MACGMAGLSVAADSLSAIKYAKVTPIRDETGLVVDYKIEGDFPKYGNDDDRVDDLAVLIQKTFLEKLKHQKTHRNSKVTLSILTITSNVSFDGKSNSEILLMGEEQELHLDQEQIHYMEEIQMVRFRL